MIKTFETTNMKIEAIDALIEELKELKSRKERADHWEWRINSLFARAKEEGFVFIDRDYGFVHEVGDCKVFDERA